METVENNSEQFIQLGHQLVELGRQLQNEERAKALEEAEESFILPENEDFLTEFGWEIIYENTCSWEVCGTPTTAHAKSIMETISKLNDLSKYQYYHAHPKIQLFHEQLQLLTSSDEQIFNSSNTLFLNFRASTPSKAAENLATWMTICRHLNFTNLSDTVNKIRKIIEKEKAELESAFNKRHSELDKTLQDLSCTHEDLVMADTIDWNDVTDGKQYAPKLIRIPENVAVSRKKGEWIYVGPRNSWGWDHCSSPLRSYGLSKKRAIAYMNNYYSDYSAYSSNYSALYRYKENGIAELVASKHKGDTK